MLALPMPEYYCALWRLSSAILSQKQQRPNPKTEALANNRVLDSRFRFAGITLGYSVEISLSGMEFSVGRPFRLLRPDMEGTEESRPTFDTLPHFVVFCKCLGHMTKTPTIRSTSRLPHSCAWAMPVVVCRPAGGHTYPGCSESVKCPTKNFESLSRANAAPVSMMALSPRRLGHGDRQISR